MKRDLLAFGGIIVVLLASLAARGEEKTSVVPPKMSSSMEVLDNVHPIKPDHLVTLRILEDKLGRPLKQQLMVTGEIQVPHIGLIKAEGLTCRVLAYKIKAELEKHFFKVATVVLISESSEPEVFYEPDPHYVPTVIVSGSVSKEGKYTLPTDADTTVSSLIMRAGGFTAIHGTPKIRVIRKTPLGNKTILVNIEAILSGKHSEYDIPLRPHDMMIVE